MKQLAITLLTWIAVGVGLNLGITIYNLTVFEYMKYKYMSPLDRILEDLRETPPQCEPIPPRSQGDSDLKLPA